jgi:transposase
MERNQIQIFSMDMWNPYKTVAEETFPTADITVDKFHLVAMMNEALDEIRKHAQRMVSAVHKKQFYMSRTALC